MAITNVQTIIKQARTYVDDSHKVTDGWKTPTDWFNFALPEIMACYRKWVREGLISLSPTSMAFTGSTTTLSSPMVIIDVVANLGSGNFRRILPAQSTFGRDPFWDNSTGTAGASQFWTMDIDSASLTGYLLQLHPPSSGNYVVKFIDEPSINTDSDVLLPTGLDDYVALRIARKALASEGASSQAIERLITIAEAEWKMLSLGTSSGDAPKVRINKYNNSGKFGRTNFTWNVNPYNWYYV